jgi:hypothetical protein
MVTCLGIPIDPTQDVYIGGHYLPAPPGGQLIDHSVHDFILLYRVEFDPVYRNPLWSPSLILTGLEHKCKVTHIAR